jgi:IS1 family transposase
MKCEECGTHFSERKGTVYFGIKKADYIFDQVMMLLMMRVCIKDICRFIAISEETIQRWINKAASFLRTIHDQLLKDLDVTECQIDEVWSFVLMKKKTAKLKGKEDYKEIGDQWIFIAIDAVKKVILHWKVGKRTLDTAKEFIKELKMKLSSSPLYTTDELPAYEEAFLANFCEEVQPEKTGKRGRPRKKVLRKVSEDLKLAQTHKHRRNGRVVEVTEEIVFGNEEEIRRILQESPVSNRINTSIIERANGTVRAKVSRMVRDTYSFSKKLEMHEDNLTIFFTYYNLIWVHSRLNKTAAWLAGLVDKAFTFRELFEFRSPEFICGH